MFAPGAPGSIVTPAVIRVSNGVSNRFPGGYRDAVPPLNQLPVTTAPGK